jgi:formylglycine-generating enzyme required for sulfatase activity
VEGLLKASGGMGTVFRAFDVKLNRIVALKTISPELAANPMAVKRFLREASMGAAVVNDHVVTIHAIDDSTPIPFLVMEYVSGLSLQDKIDRIGALRLPEILRIGMQAAEGLAAAHEQGLIHRDVKPSNILLENGVERVKITDFGLARAVDDVNITTTGQICGTPQYMSPEQAQSHPADHRSDLFSLGSVLYTMCTGRAAFRADSAIAVLRRVCDDTPRPIRELNAEIPEWLERIVEKLLAKKPEDRFQSAREVAELLKQHLAHIQQPDTVPRPAIVPPLRSRNSAPARSSSGTKWWIVALIVGLLVAPLVMVFLVLAGWLFMSSAGPAQPVGFDDQWREGLVTTASLEPINLSGPLPVDMRTWGAYVDPRGDCALVRLAERVDFKIPGNQPHDLAPGANADAPRILHDAEGDFTIEASVDVFPGAPSGSGWLEGKTFASAGLLVWENDASLLRFELARWSERNDGKLSLHAEAFAGGTRTVDETETLDAITDGVPIGFQIERRGSEIILRTRQGNSWTDWRTLQDVPLANRVKVGIAAVNTTRRLHEVSIHSIQWNNVGHNAATTRPRVGTDDPDSSQAADITGLPAEFENSLGMTMRLIPPGAFDMGSNPEEAAAAAREVKLAGVSDNWVDFVERSAQPRHTVRMPRPFYMGQHEVTVAQFRKFVEESRYTPIAEREPADETKNRPPLWSKFKDDMPATYLSWLDANEFCLWLSAKEQRTYRLPTEAQWEYGCRAGTTTTWSCGNDPSCLKDHAWIGQGKIAGPKPVGSFEPNAFGLFDMHGNVSEWCADWHRDDFYGRSPQDDPVELTQGTALGRAHRGGWWGELPVLGRSAARNYHRAEESGHPIGFRVVLTGDLRSLRQAEAPQEPEP